MNITKCAALCDRRQKCDRTIGNVCVLEGDGKGWKKEEETSKRNGRKRQQAEDYLFGSWSAAAEKRGKHMVTH